MMIDSTNEKQYRDHGIYIGFTRQRKDLKNIRNNMKVKWL